MTKLISTPALRRPTRPLRMPASAQKMGTLLPHSTKLKGRARRRSGSSIPARGHSLDGARRKKYEASRMAKTMASVMISPAMPHHADE